VTLAGVLLSPFLGRSTTVLLIHVPRIKGLRGAAVGRLVSLPRDLPLRPSDRQLAEAPHSPVGGGPAKPGGLPPASPSSLLFAVLVFSRKGSFAELTTQAARAAAGPGPAWPSSGPALPDRLLIVMVTFAICCRPARRFPLLTATSTLASCWSSPASASSSGCPPGSLCHAVFVVFGPRPCALPGRPGSPTCCPGAGRPRAGAGGGAGGHSRPSASRAVPGAGQRSGSGVLAQYLIFAPSTPFGHQKGAADVVAPRAVRVLLHGDKLLYFVWPSSWPGSSPSNWCGHPARAPLCEPWPTRDRGRKERGGQPHRLPGHRVLPHRLPRRHRRWACRVADPGRDPTASTSPVVVLDRRASSPPARRRWEGRSALGCPAWCG